MKDLMSLAIVPSPRSLIVLLILLINQSATAQDDPKVHKFTLGSYFSQGDYGSTEETDITYFPISYELTTFPWVLSVTAPYLALQGPGDVFFETGNIVGGRDEVNEFVDEQGIGDVFLSATYQFPPVLNDWVFVDFTLQAKLPTADETRDLGTGELDLGYQLDFYSTLERNTYFSTLGYRQRGKTPLFDLENSFYASLGMMRQYGDNTFLGLIYDYRERASSNAFESHELMPFVSYNLGKQWNFMLYTIVGFTASSADQTFGLQASYTLP
jgi:hypothetical protein